MFRNVHFDYGKNKINLWETIDGERMFTEIDWVPYIFVPDKRGNIKTIDGVDVKKLEFQNYQKYKAFNEDKSLIRYEDHVKPELQFLAERYYGIPDDQLYKPALRIGSLDIEVHIEKGFPKPEEALGTVTAITMNINGVINTWGIKPYAGKHKKNFVYCQNEELLLTHFFDFMKNKADIDILTGWNISGYDIPYLYYRCKRLFGENEKIFRKFSPIEECSVWDKKEGGLNFDFGGISILDYMEVYKNYTRSNPESYRLDDVCFNELKERKLEYEGTLKELYENEWETYVDYNIQDTSLILKLEKKLQYINLIQTISILSRCPMKFYDKNTIVLEGIFLTYYRRNGLCAPKLKGGNKESFVAAFVKEPQRGLHEWVVDFDVTSMYPHNMITLNMSPETYFGCIVEMSEHEVIECTTKREFPPFLFENVERKVKELSGVALKTFNAHLKNGKISIAPNGAVFKTSKEGVVTIIEKIFFQMRKDTKNKMLQLKKEEGDKNKIAELETTQLAIKVGILNSLYGALSTPYFRLYNLRIAEAITACGRHILTNSAKYLNDYLNAEAKTQEPIDFILYQDTDSMFVGMGEYIKSNKELNVAFNSLKSNKAKVDMILELCKKLQDVINDYSFNVIQNQHFASQEKVYTINWKQEIVALSILLVQKKKYGCWIINEEGKNTDKIKVTGLDIIRSETPKQIKMMLKDFITMLLKKSSEEDIKTNIRQCIKQIKSFPVEEFSSNVSVNNIGKYITDVGVVKGCPFHVKGVYTYNTLINRYGLEDKYETINDGDKCKVVYLKPNKYKFDVITYPFKFPKEILSIEPDVEKMINKFFINKISFLLEPCNKLHLIDMNEDALNFFF